MTVGFDVTWMRTDNRAGGIFQYAYRLISALVEHTDSSIVAIVKSAGKGVFEHLNGHKNFREAIVRPFGSFPDIVSSEKIDIVHTPIQYFSNFTYSVPMISTLHDLQHFYYPEFFKTREIKFRNLFYKYSAEFGERSIVSFGHIKKDIIRFYGIPEGKIDVCPVGFMSQKSLDGGLFQVIRKKYAIPENYIIYMANTWRHKNHIGLIRALKTVHEKYGLKIHLVCTGYKYPDYFPVIQSAINNLNLNDFVRFTGYVQEEEALKLLKNSTLVVIPTLYEAGSFPLMEAMAYEVPVICSNVTSLPGTIGDKRFIFDPNDIDSIAEKIAIMLTDAKLREENMKNSKTRISNGNWQNVVPFFLESYKKAIEGFKKKRGMEYLKARTKNFCYTGLGFGFHTLNYLSNLKGWRI